MKFFTLETAVDRTTTFNHITWSSSHNEIDVVHRLETQHVHDAAFLPYFNINENETVVLSSELGSVLALCFQIRQIKIYSFVCEFSQNHYFS